MKGISPLIASVLLIAFTVAVAGVISVFFTNLTTSSTASVNASTQVQIRCSGSVLSISNSSSTTWQVNYNAGIETLSSVSLTLIDGNGTATTLNCNPTTLTAGSVCVVSSAGQVLNPISGRARALCQGTAPVIANWP